MKENLEGFHCKPTLMLDKYDMEIKKVYLLKDYDKTVGLFDTLEMAEAWWYNTYLPKKDQTFFQDRWF